MRLPSASDALLALGALRSLRSWGARRRLVAAGAAVGTTLLVAVPTDLLPNPLFGRDVPPTWWAWPSLLLSSLLAGLLVATYVAVPGSTAPGGTTADSPDPAEADRPGRRGLLGGVLTFFAVGCPVCNKLVLLALGYAGAMTWFQPVQPVLQVLALALLATALVQRLRGEQACSVPLPERSLRA